MLIENYKKIYREIYSKIDLEKILKTYNIQYKAYYSNRGKEFMGLCPFHDDTTPSFSIQKNTGIYNCFVCGGGDFIKFIKNLEKLNSTKETIEFIKRKLGMTETSNVFSIVENSSFCFFEKNIDIEESNEEQLKEIKLPPSEPAENFFDIVKKRVTLDDIKRYGMRYCVKDRIFHDRLIIPIYMDDKLVSFAARDMSGKAEIWTKVKKIIKQKKLTKVEKQKLIDKYLYKKILYPFGSPLSRLFFNWDEAVKHKEVFICEGIFDALKIRHFGYNALALLSCHLNSYKTNRLVQYFDKILIALDNDNNIDSLGQSKNPGQDAAEKIMQEYLTDIQVLNLVLPFGKDPDDCSKLEFDRALEEAKKMKKVFTLPLH
jgi:DNA primase